MTDFLMMRHFRQIGLEFERRNWLADSVTVDSFVTTRAYAGRLAGADDGDRVPIYRLLCPAVIDRDAGTAAAVEDEVRLRTPPVHDNEAAAEALLAECLPGLCPDRPCRALEEVRNQAPPAADFFTRYGYRCLGPILSGFGGWVWGRRQVLGRGVLVGLLRDGRLLGQAVAAACPDAGNGLREAWLSRQVCLTAAIRSADDREGLRTLLIRARAVPATVGQALDELGLSAERDRCPLVADQVLDGTRFEAFWAWLAGRAALRAHLDHHCRTLRRAVIDHLGAANALDQGDIGLVDVGYAGNLQRALAIILAAEGRSTPLWGAYLITSEGALWTAATAGPIWGYLAAYGAPSWLSSLWLRARDLFEAVLAQPYGALTGYGPGGVAIPGPSPLPAAQVADVARIQEGALAFVRRWRAQRRDGDSDGSVELAQARLIAARMALLPSPEEVRRLGDWLCDDALAVGQPRRLTAPVVSARDAFLAPRARLLWPAGSAVAAAATPSEVLAAWMADRAVMGSRPQALG